VRLDPVLLEILRNKLTAIAEEMGITLQRTGRTLYVKETADFGTALANTAGKFFAFPVGIGVAGFVDLDCGMTIDSAGVSQPGDVIVTNHPYESGGLCTHTPDLQLVRPYFHKEEVVGYGWSFVHSADVGGKVPSSVSPTNTEAYQEGLLIPPMKIVRRGEFNDDFLRLYRANVRTPDINLGDIKAMLAALELGQRRVTEVIEQHGLQTFKDAQVDLIDYAEAKARDAFRQIPDGTYEFWDYLDDDAFSQVPVRIRVQITVDDGRIELDYSGTDPQTLGPFNVVTLGRSHPWVTLRLLAYAVTRDPSCPVNSGVFRNVTVNLPKGSVLNPEFPAASGIRTASGVRCYDVLNGALSKALPEFMPATPGGNIVPLVLVEPPEAGGRRRVTVIQFVVGATGGGLDRDGTDARDPSFSNMANNPIETVEAEASVIVREYGIRPDSGGPGRWRGGAGQMISFEVRRDGCQLLARGLERLRFPPWGSAGGKASKITRVVLNLGGEDERDLGKLDMVTVNRGDVVTALMSGAGGYGDPFERDAARVLRDVERGVVTVQGAEDDYGVVITDGRIDVAESDRLRAARSEPPDHDFHFGPERAAWESVFDHERMLALNARLESLPVDERQRRRNALFRALEPRLMTPATERRYDFTELFADAQSMRSRLDALFESLLPPQGN
jgi:N-methylhydantoinase B